MLLNLCFSPVCLLLQGPFSQESGMVQEKLFFLPHNIVVFVMPNVRIPEWEERGFQDNATCKKKGSLLLTRVRAPAASPMQWCRVREH